MYLVTYPDYIDKEIIELIRESNNSILYIPPYSPNYNPIEGVFHILKYKIRTKNEEINKINIKSSRVYRTGNWYN